MPCQLLWERRAWAIEFLPGTVKASVSDVYRIPFPSGFEVSLRLGLEGCWCVGEIENINVLGNQGHRVKVGGRTNGAVCGEDNP